MYTKTKLIVGLGNPGHHYANTHHNVGFMAVDYIASRYTDTVFKTAFGSLVSTVNINGINVLLVKPQTFMNLSGTSVVKILNYYKLSSQDMVVIHDDVYLPVGKVRLREEGTSGGHNGVQSIIESIGTDKFTRIKIGIGRNMSMELADWVLSEVSDSDKHIISDKLNEVTELVKNHFCKHFKCCNENLYKCEYVYNGVCDGTGNSGFKMCGCDACEYHRMIGDREECTADKETVTLT